MRTSKYVWMAAAVLTLAACNNDEEFTDNGPVEARISAGVNTPETRAIDDRWEQDAIGVMVTSATGTDSKMPTLYKNVKYTTTTDNNSAATFTAETGKGIFFQDASETVTFAAYGPYQTSTDNATLPGTNGEISSSTADQSTRDNQKAFDYIYASGATASQSSPTVEFKEDHAFAHKMTRLVIIVKTSTDDGFTAEEVKGGTYTLSGLEHSGTFNVTTGVAAATTTGAKTADEWSLTTNSLKSEADNQVTFTSILYPQTLGGALTFKAEIDGQTYTNNTAIRPALAAGTSYTYTITVKKTGLTVSGCTISNWSGGTGGNGDATMQ